MLGKNKDLIAVSWDHSHLHYIVASGNRLRIRAAGSLERTTTLNHADGNSRSVGELLKPILQQSNALRGTLLVALRRSQLDVVDVELPPGA